MSKPLNRGRVRTFNEERGFGFILDEDGRLIFCHYSNIDVVGHKTLQYNQEVEFDLYETSRGLEALNIKPLGILI
jgi:CspA family cold shock protein